MDVPVFLTIGRHDSNTPPELAKQWLDALDAPKKEWIWFEDSAHSPLAEESERWNRVFSEQFYADSAYKRRNSSRRTRCVLLFSLRLSVERT
jgi:pimeloyl-ACP methyl ester carboxylesterase